MNNLRLLPSFCRRASHHAAAPSLAMLLLTMSAAIQDDADDEKGLCWRSTTTTSKSEPSNTKRQSTVLVPTTTMKDTNDNADIGMSPTLPMRIIRPNPDLEIAFDVRTRIPVYVLERLHGGARRGQSRSAPPRRRPNFYEERALPEQYRSRPSHYRGSGYDRGHMAPAADFPESPEDTFTLCNVAPQDHRINVTIWNRLEAWVRRVANEHANSDSDDDDDERETYVVTGPLWLPTHQVDENKYGYTHVGIGRPPSLVHVPTHFFKVVVVVQQNQIRQFACFVVENYHTLDDDEEKYDAKKKKLEDYVVQWTDLETVTGLQFFPRLADANWKARADQVTRDSNLLAKTTTASSSNKLSLLLLTTTGGNHSASTTTTSQKKARRQSADTTRRKVDSLLKHLCMDGKCR